MFSHLISEYKPAPFVFTGGTYGLESSKKKLVTLKPLRLFFHRDIYSADSDCFILCLHQYLSYILKN